MVRFSQLACIGVMLTLVAGLVGAEEEGESVEQMSVEEMRAKAKAEADRQAREAADREGGEEGAGFGEQIGGLMPKGEEARNVTIPSFEDGVMSSLTEAAVVAFAEDSKEDLEMTEMTIQLFDGEGEVELVIELETAGYNIPTGLLESDTRARVKNEQIDLVGDQLIYDTTTRKGKLLRPTMFLFGPEAAEEGEQAENTPSEEIQDE
ncbi:MAG: hypothetical protein AAGD22_16840 [Verrucomicrobiota bacterium]